MFSSLLLFLCLISLGKSEDFNVTLAREALQFAAIAYSDDPTQCLEKNNATMIFRIQKPCDFKRNECRGLILLNEEFIIVSFRGTRSQGQLIIEILDAMNKARRKVRALGAVQHYFFIALRAIWHPMLTAIRKLKKSYPDHKILFTGHSLGGALASLASTEFAHRHPHYRNKTCLITFGQPRVGNHEYAKAHDRLVENSWRVVHKYDIVAHLPFCSALPVPSGACLPVWNTSPFHHGTEIWFPDDMAENSLFMVCDGLPRDEDLECSNKYFTHYSIKDHFVYFGHDVSKYGRNNCNDPVK